MKEKNSCAELDGISDYILEQLHRPLEMLDSKKEIGFKQNDNVIIIRFHKKTVMTIKN